QSPDNRFRNNLELNFRHDRFSAEIVVVAREHDLGIGNKPDELESAGADRVLCEIGGRAVRHNADSTTSQIPEEWSKRFFQFEYESVIVWVCDRLHEPVRPGFWCLKGTAENAVECEDDVASC